MQLMTYVNYPGTCEDAFNFYARHLRGRITNLMRHKDSPGPSNTGPEWGEKVLHAHLDLGGSALLGADVPNAQPMRSAYLTLTVDTVAEAERIFPLLSDGGEIFMPMQQTFFASRFAMMRDRFGTSWMLLGPQATA